MLTLNSGRAQDLPSINSPNEIITQDQNTISNRYQAGMQCASGNLSNSVMGSSEIKGAESIQSGVQIVNQDPLRITPFEIMKKNKDSQQAKSKSKCAKFCDEHLTLLLSLAGVIIAVGFCTCLYFALNATMNGVKFLFLCFAIALVFDIVI